MHNEHVIPHHQGQRMLPLNADPPEHGLYRTIIAPAFMQRNLVALEEAAREVAIATIEELRPRGECEFMNDFARVLPITVILGLLGLPLEDRHKLLPLAEAVVRTAGLEQRIAGERGLSQYLKDWIDRRIAEPGNDLISRIALSQVEGRPVTREEIDSMCFLLLLGGLDTVASMLGFIARFLAGNPAHRHQLLDQPQLMRTAIEELIRRHGIPNTARLVTHDFEFAGAPLRQGDLIQVPNCLYGLDDRKVENPLRVDFTRNFPVPHAAFGNGPHTCVGAMLARREIKVFLEEWLKRIPDFDVKPGSKPVIVSGRTNSINRLELVWPI